MTTVYVYVMNTMADWEIGYCLAELHSKRFFRKGFFPDQTVGVNLKISGFLRLLSDSWKPED